MQLERVARECLAARVLQTSHVRGAKTAGHAHPRAAAHSHRPNSSHGRQSEQF
jgi:hypothetical protein